MAISSCVRKKFGFLHIVGDEKKVSLCPCSNLITTYMVGLSFGGNECSQITRFVRVLNEIKDFREC